MLMAAAAAGVLDNDNVADDCHIDLGPLFPTQASDGPVIESPLPVPLFPNPNLLDSSSNDHTLPDLNLALTAVSNRFVGDSSSTSPRSGGSSSSGSPSKNKRAIKNKGKCAYPLGCNKYRQNGTKFCVKHGGVRRCAVEGCPNAAKRGDNSRAVFCIRHGGGKSCRVPGCGVSARGSTGYCYKHRKLAETRTRKDSAASTVSGSGSDVSDQNSHQLATIEVPGLALDADQPIDLTDAIVTAAAAEAAAAGGSPESLQWSSFASSWNGYPAAAGIPSLAAASMNFMDLSDEKWTDFLKPMEPLPELLTNHINQSSTSDSAAATEQLHLF